MKQYYRYDENGYYVEPVITEYSEENPMPDDVTDVRPPDGLYRAKFTGSEWIETGSPPEPDIDELKLSKLTENSTLCEQIITTEFKSEAKGDGLQPYRMNEHDQINLSGMQGMINTLLVTGTATEDMPLFSWQNANQVKCDDDWHYSQILELIGEFGVWKTFVLKRQDEIKERILEAQTAEEVSAVVIDYSDLLDYGEKL